MKLFRGVLLLLPLLAGCGAGGGGDAGGGNDGGAGNDANVADALPPGAVCAPGTTRACYTGSAMTRGVGRCQDGTQTCDTEGLWGSSCGGEVLPLDVEICGNHVDDNCNGAVDDCGG